MKFVLSHEEEEEEEEELDLICSSHSLFICVTLGPENLTSGYSVLCVVMLRSDFALLSKNLLIFSRRIACSMTGYWHHSVICLSIRLSVCLSVMLCCG